MVAQFDCQPELMQSCPPAVRHGNRHGTGAWRDTALSHHSTGDAVANRGGERPAVGPAAGGAGQSIRRRRRWRAAHHAEMRIARGDLHQAWCGPAALLPARADQSDAGFIRIAGCPRRLDRLRRQRGGPGSGDRARHRDRAGGILRGRGTVALVGSRLLRLPSAHRILRVPRQVPVLRLHPDRREDTGIRRQPAGDLRLPGSLPAGTGTHDRSAVDGVGLHAAGQPVPAALRAGDTEPYGHRVSHRAGCPPSSRRRNMERRAGAGDTAGWLVPPLAPVPSADRQRRGTGGGRWLLPHRAARCRAGRAGHRGIPRAARSRFRSGSNRQLGSCRSTRSVSIATCRRICRSVAAILGCGWWKAPPRWPR